MSPRRRANYDDGLGRGRQAAADQLMNHLTKGATPARDWSTPPRLPAGKSRGLEELIGERGGVAGLARDLGVARSTVQGWRNRGVAPRAASREKLSRVNEKLNAAARRAAAEREFGELAKRYGGATGLARAVGVSSSTAQRWLTGQSAPSAGNLAALKRADMKWRMARTHRLKLGADGKPDKRVYFRTRGEAKVIGNSGSPEDDRGSRSWGEGTPGLPGVEFHDKSKSGAGLDEFWNSAADGDELGTLDAFQSFMSNEVTNCSGYDQSAGIGVFFENFEDFELIEDQLEEPDEQDLFGGLEF